MHQAVCDHGWSAPDLDLRSACTRSTLSILGPASLVALFCLVRALRLATAHRTLAPAFVEPFQKFITLRDAEAIAAGTSTSPPDEASAKHSPSWLSALALPAIAILEAVAWTIYGSYQSVSTPVQGWAAVLPFAAALTWVYSAIRAILSPQPTPHYDILTILLAQLVGALLMLGGIAFDAYIKDALPSVNVIVLHIINFFAILALNIIILAKPLAIRSPIAKRDDAKGSASPEDYTTLWGWVSFSWVAPLLARGAKQTLGEKDVWLLSPTMQSHVLFERLAALKPHATLLRRIWAANSMDMILDVTLTVVSISSHYATPYFLKRILDIMRTDSTREARATAYVYAALIPLFMIFKAQTGLQHLWFIRRAATRTRSELMALIYAKALKRKDFSGVVDPSKGANPSQPTKGGGGADVGKIVNLMSGDANRIANVYADFYFLYQAPLEVAVASVLLFQLLGPSAFAGVAILVLNWPLNSLVVRRSIKIQGELSGARDRRMNVLNELFGAIKIVKFFAWEQHWITRVLSARSSELNLLRKAANNGILARLLWSLTPILVSLVSFATFVSLGNTLDVATAFTALTLFDMIRLPLNTIPAFTTQVLQTGVSVKRIEEFLKEDEVDEEVSALKESSTAPQSVAENDGLGFENAYFRWNSTASHQPPVSAQAYDDDEEQDSRFELRNLNIRFPERALTVVTGPTASGKTALLMALLGEMTQVFGRRILTKDASRVDEHGFAYAISYTAQMPWLRHASIRDNIIFGYPYEEDRYHQVIECCALSPDLEILEDGDMTEIGAGGITLSGGQKARVALARAVYARTKYVFLDDPLSAVDSHTSRFLFERLFSGPLLVNRTVVLVTHHVGLVLPACQYLVHMLNGRIEAQGTPEGLRARGLLHDSLGDSSKKIENDGAGPSIEAPTVDTMLQEVKAEAKEVAKVASAAKTPRQLVQDERRETGGVKWSIYNTYLKSSTYWTWCFLIIFIIFSQGCVIVEKLWIRTWGQAHPQSQSPVAIMSNTQILLNQVTSSAGSTTGFAFRLPDASSHPMFYVGVYAAIGLSAVVITLLSSVVQYLGALRASRILFKQLLENVVFATMRWHDTTPQGRILNRFSKDVETVDSSLASSLQSLNTTLAGFIASILTITVIFPWFLIPALLNGLVYYRFASVYSKTSRDLRRMESTTRSPLFSGFSELLSGVVTVRAFAAEKRFLDEVHTKIDLTTQMWYFFWMLNRWLLLRFEFLGALMVFTTIVLSLFYSVDAGLAGVCITSAMAFNLSMYFTCRNWTALEVNLNSVERVIEYLNLPQEPLPVIESHRPPAYWPSSSNKDDFLRVQNLTVKYAPELPDVLHNVSFSLKCGERVGILGRTGSGKSTLAMSIMRFVDPTNGQIVIDGVDISMIGTHDLRSRITYIPQEATLFSGTLRENLDPFNEHSDEECLEALRRVYVVIEEKQSSQPSSHQVSSASSVHSAPSSSTLAIGLYANSNDMPRNNSQSSLSLLTQVSSGGTNFSQGQRQLIAMARALLKQSTVVILDEATSSIDFSTDAKIQTSIREEFQNSLLLTIAHRIQTVIDYDRLIVLDNGSIAEFDTPYNLISKEGGIFRNMCLKSGKIAELEAIAKEQIVMS